MQASLTGYDQVTRQREQRHSQKLADYWVVELPEGRPEAEHCLQLCATKRRNGQLFAYFDVPEQIVGETYDLYTG